MTQPTPSIQNPYDLMLDSGATGHILCTKDLFQKGTFQSVRSYCETGLGEELVIEGKGTLLIPLSNEENIYTDLILTDVLFFPSFKYNLISTIRLGKKGVSTYLRSDGKPSQLMYKDKVIGLAKEVNDQYILQTSTLIQAFATAHTTKSSIQIWHERLGHLSYPNFLKLNQLAQGVTIEGSAPRETCGPCMVGRQERKIHRTPRTQSTELAKLIHSDLGGPLPATRFG